MDQRRPDQPGGPGSKIDPGRISAFDEAPERRAGESDLPGINAGAGGAIPESHLVPPRPGGDSGDRGRDLKQQVAREGSRVLEQVRDQADSVFSQGKERLAEQVSGLGRALEDAAQRLEGGNQGIGGYANSAARSLTDAAEYLRDSDPRRIMRDIQGFARRRPDLFIGGALVAGVLIGRFLRSSGKGHMDMGDRDDRDRGRTEPAAQRDRMDTDRMPGGIAGTPGTNGPGIGPAAGERGAAGTDQAGGSGTSDPRVNRRGFEGDSGGA